MMLYLGRAAVPPAPVPLEQEAPWRIVNFATDAGVARRNVFDVAFTTNNLAWFAASDGLYRYDGYHWRRFTTAQGLPSNLIRTVSIFSDGTLWVGTDNGAGVFSETGFDRQGTLNQLAGPNVRRIVATSDGSLWFCCDRWPDPAQPGGLTRRRGGEYRNYGVKDGLPSDHLLGLFEQSNGRILALTTAGAAVLNGDRWSPLADPGYPANDHTWTFCETPDRELFAQCFSTAMRFQEGRWQPCPQVRSQENAPLCVTRDGSVIEAYLNSRGTVGFARWNGQEFVRASAEATGQVFNLHTIRQAPDGAIWAVGRGTILRWEYLPGAWTWRPDLPPPIMQDHQERLWFGDRNKVAYEEKGTVHEVEKMREPLFEDGRGGIWGKGPAGPAHWIDGKLEFIAEEQSHMTALQGGVTDAAGTAWIFGKNRRGEAILAEARADGWQVWGPEVFGNRWIVSLVPDPHDGVWLVLADVDSVVYDIYRVTTAGVRLLPLGTRRAPTRTPALCISATKLYCLGYNGLWESPLGNELSFERTPFASGQAFSAGGTVGSATAFLSQEGVAGNAMVFVRRENDWFQQAVRYGDNFWLSRDGWLLVADGSRFLLWQICEWNSGGFVHLPFETMITAMVRAVDGSFWLGTLNGVLHLRPGPTPPETVITGPEKILAGSPLDVNVTGLGRFTSRARTGQYSFEWRLDSQAWSGYGVWPTDGIPTTGLSSQPHRLEVRARDAFGLEDPTPASLTFSIVPHPLQHRPWFRPLVALIGLSLAALSLALLAATSRLKRYAGGLEREVQERTAQLREDITRREQVEAHLRESEEKYRVLVENAGEGIFVVQAGYLVYTNAKGEQLAGYPASQLITRPLADFIHPEERELVLERLQPPADGTTALVRYAFRLLSAAAQIRWVEVTAVGIDWRGGPATLNFVSDITERKQAEAERERLMLAMEQAAEIVVITDATGSIQYVNRAFVEITGYARSEAIGRNPRLLKSGKHGPAFYQRLWSVLAQGKTWSGRFINRKKDGTLYTEEATIAPVRDAAGKTVNYVATKRDITEEIRLHDQLMQAQKMESVGRLAGGVAHDFNNMLQAIVGNVELALNHPAAAEGLREELGEIQQAATRSIELTRQLLAFARKQTVAPKTLDLNATVAGMLKMLTRLIGENIQLSWRPGSNLWPICMDPAQIDQILANLTVNARDAISGAGTITIETINTTLDNTYAASHDECAPGDYVVLIVSDSGCGMNPEIQAHIFEPFFTTKEVGKGTGLGLATIFGIVKQNHGLINVYSEPGRGTTFKIYLRRETVETRAAAIAAPSSSTLRGTETLLLVEDEIQILNLGQRILQNQGYTVLAASTPQEALNLVERRPGKLDLLITDVVMPEFNGRQLHERLLAAHPGLKCLYVSGYTADVIAHQGVLDQGVQFLQKPFTIQALSSRVREVLDGK